MLKQKVEYRWRNKKTGWYVRARTKGSKRIIFASLRWAKGTPKAGQYQSIKVYEPKQFISLKEVPFKKEKGTLLYRQFGDLKVYTKVIKSKAKLLEVKVSGMIKGKRWSTKILINLFGRPTSEAIRDTLIGRVLKQLGSEGIRLSPEKYESVVYTPSEYSKMRLLKKVRIELMYV